MHNSSEIQYLWIFFSPEFKAEDVTASVTVSVVYSCHRERSGGYLQDVMRTSQQLEQSEHARPQKCCSPPPTFLFFDNYKIHDELTVTPERRWTLKLSQFNTGDCWKYTYFIGISIFY